MKTKTKPHTKRTSRKHLDSKLKLNIYARNMVYINNQKNRKYLSKLTDFLAEDEWLKISKDKYRGFSFELDKKTASRMIGYKPPYVSWFSKGSWLFHENCCNIDQELIYIKVDYKNIYKITNSSPNSNLVTDQQYKKQLTKFNKKYIIIRHRNRMVHRDNLWSGCEFIENKETCEKGNQVFFTEDEEKEKEKNKVQCKWNKKTQKCGYRPCLKKSGDCVIHYGFPYHNWGKFFQNHDGLAIYPMMTLDEMEKIQNHHALMAWDVETLMLLNDKPIVKHYNLGTIRELLNIPKKEEDDMVEFNYSKLVSALIKKITEIRNSKI
jgi:hypothetical protein